MLTADDARHVATEQALTAAHRALDDVRRRVTRTVKVLEIVEFSPQGVMPEGHPLYLAILDLKYLLDFVLPPSLTLRGDHADGRQPADPDRDPELPRAVHAQAGDPRRGTTLQRQPAAEPDPAEHPGVRRDEEGGGADD
jgi:hypothetical protein